MKIADREVRLTGFSLAASLIVAFTVSTVSDERMIVKLTNADLDR